MDHAEIRLAVYGKFGKGVGRRAFASDPVSPACRARPGMCSRPGLPAFCHGVYGIPLAEQVPPLRSPRYKPGQAGQTGCNAMSTCPEQLHTRRLSVRRKTAGCWSIRRGTIRRAGGQCAAARRVSVRFPRHAAGGVASARGRSCWPTRGLDRPLIAAWPCSGGDHCSWPDTSRSCSIRACGPRIRPGQPGRAAWGGGDQPDRRQRHDQERLAASALRHAQ